SARRVGRRRAVRPHGRRSKPLRQDAAGTLPRNPVEPGSEAAKAPRADDASLSPVPVAGRAVIDLNEAGFVTPPGGEGAAGLLRERKQDKNTQLLISVKVPWAPVAGLCCQDRYPDD